MTIHLPAEVERSLQASVEDGFFATLDEAMAEAARLLLMQLKGRLKPGTEPPPDTFIGSMRDYADELDEIVADAYRRRREGF